MAADMATKYFTADNGATGAPKVCGVSWTAGAWQGVRPRGRHLGVGGLADHVHGRSSLNFSDLDLADLPAMLERMRAAAEGRPP